MNLTHQDIQEILRLLDDSPYDELNLKTDRFQLCLKRGEGAWSQESLTFAPEREVEEAAAAADAEAPEIAASEAGLLDIRAPMAGTFYRAPKPGAEPFVEVGSRVDADSVIAIIEVMKLMSSIAAGYRGEVVEILVDDSAYVEKGRLLMRVRPEDRSRESES